MLLIFKNAISSEDMQLKLADVLNVFGWLNTISPFERLYFLGLSLGIQTHTWRTG